MLLQCLNTSEQKPIGRDHYGDEPEATTKRHDRRRQCAGGVRRSGRGVGLGAGDDLFYACRDEVGA